MTAAGLRKGVRRAAAGLPLAAGIAVSAAPAVADILAGAARYGGPAQTTVVCLFTNVGPKAVVIADYAVLSVDGSTILPRASSCGRSEPFSLAPGTSCFIAASVRTDEAHACRATMADKTKVRGSIEVRDDAGSVLRRAPLR